MSRWQQVLVCAGAAALGLVASWGCDSSGNDSNPQVFRNADQVAAGRRARQLREWQETAVVVVQQERPGVKATATGQLSVAVEADGVREAYDLSPVQDQLQARSGQAASIIAEYLRPRLSQFDQARLARQPFDQVKPKLRPMLLSADQLAELKTDVSPDPFAATNTVVVGVYWVPAVRTTPEILAPVSPRPAVVWKVTPQELSAASMENVAAEVKEGIFETTSFGSLGRVGNLKAGVEPGVVLTPKFLAEVRKEWKTDDELALLLGSASDIRFVESKQKRLLDSLYPQWQFALASNSKPLARKPLLLGERGPAEMDYIPPLTYSSASSRPAFPFPQPNLPGGAGMRYGGTGGAGGGPSAVLPSTRPTTRTAGPQFNRPGVSPVPRTDKTGK
jgi:hypothetical protein